MTLLFLLLGLGLILAGASLLTDGAAALARRFRIPEFIVGLTVVAVGTSTPELIVSVLSAAGGHSGMAIVNVVGSNLFNVFVILGVCALIAPLPLTPQNIRRDIPVSLGASVLLLALCLPLGHRAATIGRIEGAAMLLLYAAALWYTVRTTPRTSGPSDTGRKPRRLWFTALMIAAGLGALIGGGELFLHHATLLARRLGVSESVIAITLVAGGTSLPELASSVVSLLKGKGALALGNVLGSNIANILLILGLSAVVRPLDAGSVTLLDTGAVVLSTAMLCAAAFTFRRRELDRPEGVLFLLAYAGYLYVLLK